MYYKLLLLVFLFNIFISPQDIPDTFYKRYEGSIDGKYNIVVNLRCIDSSLSGSYYYTNKGELINFIRSSIDSAGNIYLEEDAGFDTDYKPKTSGIFKGKFKSPGEITGTWEKPGGKKPLPFFLEEKYPAGSAQFGIKQYSKVYSDYGSAKIEFTMLQLINAENKRAADSINRHFSYFPDFSVYDDSTNSAPPKSADELMDNFIGMYINDIVKDSVNYDGHIPEYEASSSVEILYNNDNILSVSNINFTYLGGAHPNTLFTLVSFDLATGKKITTADLFKPGFEKKLYELGEKQFRKFYQLDDNKSLNDQGFWFEDGFKLNDNFYITKAGIKFLFNPYEVGPYALGAPEVYFRFSDIKDLLREDSIITAGLKKD
jgi:hypothetical protein